MFEQIEHAVQLIRDPNKEFYLNTVNVFFEKEDFMENPLWVGISVALLISILSDHIPKTDANTFAQDWMMWMEGVLPSDFVGKALPQDTLSVALQTLQEYFFIAHPDLFHQDLTQ